MKKLLLALSLFFADSQAEAQSIYGFSASGFVKYHLDSNTYTTLIPNYQSFYGYQGSTTSDHVGRYFRIIQGDYAFPTVIPDTLLIIDIRTLDVQKKILDRKNEDLSFIYPAYHNENLYALSSRGLIEYNLTHDTQRVVTTMINTSDATVFSQASFNHASNTYIFQKKSSVSSPTIPDTLFFYNITSNSLVKDTMHNVSMTNIEYSEKRNRFYGVGISTSTGNILKGIFNYYYTTRDMQHAASWNYGGITSTCSAFDTAGERYFVVAPSSQMNVVDTLVIFNALTNTIVKKTYPKNGFNNFEYIRPVTSTDPPTGINEVQAAGNFFIYPNPVNKELFVTAINASTAKVKVLNLLGMLCNVPVTASGSEEIRVDVSALPAGQYLIGAEQAGARTQWQRFIKD